MPDCEDVGGLAVDDAGCYFDSHLKKLNLLISRRDYPAQIL